MKKESVNDVIARRCFEEDFGIETYEYLRRCGVGRLRSFWIAWKRYRMKAEAIRIQQARRLGR